MKTALLALATTVAMSAVSAHATTIRLDGPETDLQEIVNNLTIDGSSSVDVVNDQYGLDASWQVDSIFGAQGRIVMELAGYAGSNELGIYDIYNSSARVQLFAGSHGAGATTMFDIANDGSVYRNNSDTGVNFTSNLFGFYLRTPDGVWFSQTGLNTDGADHLVAYQGEGDLISGPLGTRTWGSDMFLLGWEDLRSTAWDQDYNDFALFVSGVNGVSVPEPTTLGLIGLGLAGMGVFGRRKKVA